MFGRFTAAARTAGVDLERLRVAVAVDALRGVGVAPARVRDGLELRSA